MLLITIPCECTRMQFFHAGSGGQSWRSLETDTSKHWPWAQPEIWQSARHTERLASSQHSVSNFWQLCFLQGLRLPFYLFTLASSCGWHSSWRPIQNIWHIKDIKETDKHRKRRWASGAKVTMRESILTHFCHLKAPLRDKPHHGKLMNNPSKLLVRTNTISAVHFHKLYIYISYLLHGMISSPPYVNKKRSLMWCNEYLILRVVCWILGSLFQ